MSETFRNRRFWLTGASRGIGRALALALAERGARIALSARPSDELENLAEAIGPAQALAVPLDVTSRRANQQAMELIEAAWGGLDVAILNAGTAEYVEIGAFDAALFERVLQTNLMSTVYGVEAALPLLRAAEAPRLVGMASAAAYRGLPRAEAYGASKAAIKNMMEGLRISLAPEGIDVHVVCPGFVRTPLTDKNDFPMPMRIEPEAAAEAILRGLARGRGEIHFPKGFTYAYKLLAALPSGVYTRLIGSTVWKKQG